MPMKIRPLAICIFRQGDKILVAEGRDPVKGETFFRPLGGGIEFGEYAHQTIARELREELGVEVSDLRYLFTLENIFVYHGQRGHEIVLVYDGRLGDADLYTREAIQGQEEGELFFTAVWKSLSEFEPGKKILYPTGLYERLRTDELR
jgi:8-oxo-dGTP pyrophosphatase MutT (NUDIX family)